VGGAKFMFLPNYKLCRVGLGEVKIIKEFKIGDNMGLKRKQILMIGISLLVTGLILFVSSIIFQVYILNLDPEDFFKFINIFYIMLVSGVTLSVIGQCLILYTKHPYYADKWAKENKIIEFKPIENS
jgi:hypothetical protein